MVRNSYTPEVLEQVEQVCKDPAVFIYHQRQTTAPDIARITDVLTSICVFLKENYSEIGTLEYILKLNLSDKSVKNKLTAERILNSLNNDSKIIEINQGLSIISKDKLIDFSNSGIANYSKTNNAILIFVHNGIDLTIYVDGVPTKQINVNYPLSAPRVNKQTSRSSRDYRLSLIDFYNVRVKNNITDHWHNRAKRILKGGKTENIFQDQLTNWLTENISDGIVIPKVKKISKDETDIEIKALGGNSYLVEIKWMGVNESSTPYDMPRLKDSIHQVRNYLNIDPEVLDAALVFYDGRDLDKFKKIKCLEHQKDEWKRLQEFSKEKLPLKATCFVFYLISLSASQRKK